tara:strand:- start:798 stop:1052 length:255 start_codon:yes stop_codon:yes gene_type:complete
MDLQTAFNIAAGVAGALGSLVLKAVYDNIKSLERSDERLIAKVSEMEVLVAGRYMTRDEFNVSMAAISNKLDRIQDILSHKVDK